MTKPAIDELIDYCAKTEQEARDGNFLVKSSLYGAIRDHLLAQQAEIHHWKANHNDVVKRLQIFTQREDLTVDRIPAYKELVRLQEKNIQLKANTLPLDEVPEGWRLYKIDATIKGIISVWLIRDGEAYDAWYKLSDKERGDADLHVFAQSKDLAEAIRAAIAKVKP